MKLGERLVLLMTTAGLLLLASGVVAQVDGVSTFAETTCDGYQVDIHVTLNVYDAIPADITGWIIEREVLGRCVPNVDVGDVRPMPTDIGEHDFIIRDIPTLPGKAIYHIRAVDEGGTRLVISWPQRTHFAQADCFFGIAARGTVVIDGGTGYYLEVCPDDCWWALSYFDPIFPPHMELPPVGSVVDIHGEIIMGLEGPYIDATHWSPVAEGCMVVDLDGLHWGSLKALYW
jgi:hypothetical protein